mgnify:CR=1 FL=1
MLFFVTIINVILFLGNLYQTVFNYFNFNQLQALLLTIFLIVTVIVIAINKKLERGYDLSFFALYLYWPIYVFEVKLYNSTNYKDGIEFWVYFVLILAISFVIGKILKRIIRK